MKALSLRSGRAPTDDDCAQSPGSYGSPDQPCARRNCIPPIDDENIPQPPPQLPAFSFDPQALWSSSAVSGSELELPARSDAIATVALVRARRDRNHVSNRGSLAERSNSAAATETELCHYSGFRIYPGHGRRYIRSDGRSYVFINSKSEASFHMKRKAAKHSWTQLYRRLHKKGIQEETQRRRNRRKVSTAPKAIEGISLEVIKVKRNQRPEVRKAAREAALKEIKDRKKAAPKSKGGKGNLPKGAQNKMPVAQRR